MKFRQQYFTQETLLNLPWSVQQASPEGACCPVKGHVFKQATNIRTMFINDVTTLLRSRVL